MSSTNRGGKRSPADFYPTPSWCVARFLEAVELPGGTWLEPCAGDGAIIDAVNSARPDVTWHAVELREECRETLAAKAADAQVGDFIVTEFADGFDVLITNPPFSRAEEVLRRSFVVADHVVLLLRLNFLASARRSALMREYPPDVYVLPNRPSFDGKGTDSVEYAWFHWPLVQRRAGGHIVVLPSTPASERRPRNSCRPSTLPGVEVEELDTSSYWSSRRWRRANGTWEQMAERVYGDAARARRVDLVKPR